MLLSSFPFSVKGTTTLSRTSENSYFLHSQHLIYLQIFSLRFNLLSPLAKPQSPGLDFYARRLSYPPFFPGPTTFLHSKAPD